jgi:hypothetical protein
VRTSRKAGPAFDRSSAPPFHWTFDRARLSSPKSHRGFVEVRLRTQVAEVGLGDLADNSPAVSLFASPLSSNAASYFLLDPALAGDTSGSSKWEILWFFFFALFYPAIPLPSTSENIVENAVSSSTS